MMSMKKLLALLLALAIVFSLAACGGSESSGDKNNNAGSSNADKPNKEDEKEKETEPTKPSDEKAIIGTWVYHAEAGDALLKGITGGQQGITTDKKVKIDLEMEFKDGKLTMKGDVDEDSYTAFLIDVSAAMIYITAENQHGMDKATYEEAFMQQTGMTVLQYVDNQVKLQVAQQRDQLHTVSDAAFYKVDEAAGKIYVANKEADLENSKECVEYTIADGKLTLKKFYDEKGEETVPMDMEEVGVTLPWIFEKK